MLISFESDFSYTSKLLSEFDVDTLKIRITEDFTKNSDAEITLTTETVSDLSFFANSDERILTHLSAEIPYSGFLDGSFEYLGIVYDNIYNPILMSSAATSENWVAFTAQRSSDGEQRRFLYREAFGTNKSVILRHTSPVTAQPMLPATQSVDASTSNGRFYYTNDGGGDPDTQYTRFNTNGQSIGQKLISDNINNSGWESNNANAFTTIHSWSDASYSVVGSGDDTAAVIERFHNSNDNGEANSLANFNFPSGTRTAVASARRGTDLFLIADGTLWRLDGNNNELTTDSNHTQTPNPVASYSGYYFTRMFHEPTSGAMYLVGGTTTSGYELPTVITSQTIYKTDLFLTSFSALGTIPMTLHANQYVHNLPNSQLYMFPGSTVDIIFDASSDTIVSSASRLQDNSLLLSSGYQLTGCHKDSSTANRSLLTLKTSPAALDNFMNPTFKFMTVDPRI